MICDRRPFVQDQVISETIQTRFEILSLIGISVCPKSDYILCFLFFCFHTAY